MSKSIVTIVQLWHNPEEPIFETFMRRKLRCKFDKLYKKEGKNKADQFEFLSSGNNI